MLLHLTERFNMTSLSKTLTQVLLDVYYLKQSIGLHGVMHLVIYSELQSFIQKVTGNKRFDLLDTVNGLILIMQF